MPELPEVQTTVNGLRRRVVGLTITDVWSNYRSDYFRGSETIKDPAYFTHFKKTVIRRKIISVERRAKNILINLSGNETILIHMKMTGHLLYGHYRRNPKFEARNSKVGAQISRQEEWEPIEPESLKDPFNGHIHLMFTFNNKRHLALSDLRTFAKVTLINSDVIHESVHLNSIGPEPLTDHFTFKVFNSCLDLRPKGKIKLVLMDQKILAGIGNIYADESLWRAAIHPLQTVKTIPASKRRDLFQAIKKTLSHGIDFGGDSMSDYRNIDGEKGAFQESHHAYQKTGEKCDKRGCGGTIMRMVVGGRGTHYCNKHQRLIK